MTLDQAIWRESALAASYAKQQKFTKANEYTLMLKKLEQEHRQMESWLMSYKELIKRNTPRMVNYYGDGFYDGDMIYDGAECPNCDNDFEEDDENWGMSYCPHCGQKLQWEWEGEEDEGYDND